MNTARFAGVFLFCLLLAAASAALQKGETETRTVRGQVIDPSSNPVPRAIVYLKNTKTVQVRTYIADTSGSFHFQGLNFNVDYQVHAEHEGSSSATRTISSFDSRKDVTISLKIEKK